jgi:hypothetical protein
MSSGSPGNRNNEAVRCNGSWQARALCCRCSRHDKTKGAYRGIGGRLHRGRGRIIQNERRRALGGLGLQWDLQRRLDRGRCEQSRCKYQFRQAKCESNVQHIPCHGAGGSAELALGNAYEAAAAESQAAAPCAARKVGLGWKSTHCTVGPEGSVKLTTRGQTK